MPSDEGALAPLAYHHATKHHFGRFARSLGYLDWATQPNPFRRFDGADIRPLPRTPLARAVPYTQLWTGDATAEPVTEAAIGEFLRCAMGLSAWKHAGRARWALRVNPSSGNLHPTEAYVVWDRRVWHYAPAEHALEGRAEIGVDVWRELLGAHHGSGCLVALSSVHWREAWKYGERAFRYCQHDAGHALAALRLSASMLGWHLQLLSDWAHEDIAAVLGLDRADDFADAEAEEPDLIALVWPHAHEAPRVDPPAWVAGIRQAQWQGRANRLSPSSVEWPTIEQVARATRDRGRAPTAYPPNAHVEDEAEQVAPLARQIILQRRSATDFDPRGTLRRDAFFAMLDRLVHDDGAVPWDALTWPPHVHLALFVHRVQEVTPGIYAFLRAGSGSVEEWRASMRPEFLWEPMGESRDHGLFLLAPLDVRSAANRLSCDQDIGGDGFFSLGMVADLSTLDTLGPSHYRRLFWECGVIGQVLYLEAEAVGARATGIGCFYDDPVHEALGLRGERWQSLYHLAMGLPLEDTRLTTEPGYAWEQR